MNRSVQWLILAALLFFPLVGQARVARAQDSVEALSIASGGLINPRGFAFTTEGQLIVAEAGTGGELTATEAVPPPTGPYTGGPTGQVSRITEGCPTGLASGLASARGAGGETIGPAAVAIVDDRILVLGAGGGAAHGNPDQPAGVYDISSGSPQLVADLGGWLRANPVAEQPDADLDPDGSWYAMVADPSGESLIVVESNGEQVVRVSLDGAVERIADLSAANQVPTAVAVAPDGTIYVGHLTSAPFTAGSASVIKIAPDGASETVWSGLTMITGLEIDEEGTLYASELSGGRENPPFFVPGTGRVLRQAGPDTSDEILTQLNLPTALAFGPDGALYVSLPAVGADSGTGEILRADLSGELPLRGEDFNLAPPSCLAGTQSALIRVSDLGFDPSTVTLPTGATVTWRNTGEFDHVVASEADSAIQWDSGIMRPGDEFSVTFDQAGTYRYFDGLFPERTAEIVVVAQ